MAASCRDPFQDELLCWDILRNLNPTIVSEIIFAYVYDYSRALIKTNNGKVFNVEHKQVTEVEELSYVNIKSISISSFNMIVLVTDEGVLYYCAYNDGVRFIPVFSVLNNVRKVSCGEIRVALLNEKRELYSWKLQTEPQKLKSDVVDIDAANSFIVALSIEGAAYIWKNNEESPYKPYFNRKVCSICCGGDVLVFLLQDGHILVMEYISLGGYRLVEMPNTIATSIYTCHLGYFMCCRTVEGKIVIWKMCEGMPQENDCEQCIPSCKTLLAVHGRHGGALNAIMKFPLRKDTFEMSVPCKETVQEERKEARLEDVRIQQKELSEQLAGLEREAQAMVQTIEYQMKKESKTNEVVHRALMKERAELSGVIDREREKLNTTLEKERSAMKSALQKEREKLKQEREAVKKIFQQEKRKKKILQEITALKKTLKQEVAGINKALQQEKGCLNKTLQQERDSLKKSLQQERDAMNKVLQQERDSMKKTFKEKIQQEKDVLNKLMEKEREAMHEILKQEREDMKESLRREVEKQSDFSKEGGVQQIHGGTAQEMVAKKRHSEDSQAEDPHCTRYPVRKRTRRSLE